MGKKVRFIIAVLLIAVCTVVSLQGCATTGTTGTGGSTSTTWEKTATDVYTATGLALNTGKTVLEVAKGAQLISQEDYDSYVKIYNQAVLAYQAAGTALQTVIATTDAAQKQDAMAAYNKAMENLAPLATQVAAFVQSLKEYVKGNETLKADEDLLKQIEVSKQSVQLIEVKA